jgi:hypothetical protein
LYATPRTQRFKFYDVKQNIDIEIEHYVLVLHNHSISVLQHKHV